MFHCNIPAPTLSNATVKNDSTSLSELLLQTKLKDIRLKLKGLECRISGEHISNGLAATSAAEKNEQIIISDTFNIMKGGERH